MSGARAGWKIHKNHIRYALKKVLVCLFCTGSDNMMDSIEQLTALSDNNILQNNCCEYCKRIQEQEDEPELQESFRQILDSNSTKCIFLDILANTMLSSLYNIHYHYTHLSWSTLQEIHCESLAKNDFIYADRDVANDLYWNCLLNGRNSLTFLDDESDISKIYQYAQLRQYIDFNLASTAQKYGIYLDSDGYLNLAYIMNLNNFKQMLHMHSNSEILRKFVYVHGFG